MYWKGHPKTEPRHVKIDAGIESKSFYNSRPKIMIGNHIHVNFSGVLPGPEGGCLCSWTRTIGPRVSNEVCMYGSKKDTGCPTAKVWESLMREAR